MNKLNLKQHKNKPTETELKEFALTISWAFPLFFSVILPWLFNYAWQLWPLAISLVLMSLYLVKPAWLWLPHRIWMTIAGAIGWFNTRVILGLCFYLLVAPIGFTLRLFGKLQYQTKISQRSTSYTSISKSAASKNSIKSSDEKSNQNAPSNYVKVEAKSDKKNLEYPF
ncbi:SxtJ family membrane protein [Psychrosphaera aestuarii]|uniref:SxtJ family membrane protein n=1 Tax=Psychrosphaera aestuarii TaxID=1266052 RepID=UPI001B318C09|nr:SxtJ family membrane protein [Psychrosphaera aestuarii]